MVLITPETLQILVNVTTQALNFGYIRVNRQEVIDAITEAKKQIEFNKRIKEEEMT